MPPLLSASPVILDQSFPRSVYELRLVVESLGEIVRVIEQDEAHLVLTEALREMIEQFNWNRPQIHSLVFDVYRLLHHLFLQTHSRLIRLNTANVQQYVPHPIPKGSAKGELVDRWSDEMGRLLSIHDQCRVSQEMFLGIACAKGFSGDQPDTYQNSEGARAFPLVGPAEMAALSDGYDWEISSNIINQSVSFTSAKVNCPHLGATSVEPPRGGSHYKVRFAGERSWILDKNCDPVPDRFLKELVPITGYPFEVIKTVLINGVFPSRAIKFRRVPGVT